MAALPARPWEGSKGAAPAPAVAPSARPSTGGAMNVPAGQGITAVGSGGGALTAIGGPVGGAMGYGGMGMSGYGRSGLGMMGGYGGSSMLGGYGSSMLGGYGGGYGMGGYGMGGGMMGMGMGGYGMGGMGMGGMGMGMMGPASEVEQRSHMTFMLLGRVVELFGMFASVIQMVFGSVIQFMGSYVGLSQQYRALQDNPQQSPMQEGAGPVAASWGSSGAEEGDLGQPIAGAMRPDGSFVLPENRGTLAADGEYVASPTSSRRKRRYVVAQRPHWTQHWTIRWLRRLVFAVLIYYTARRLLRWWFAPSGGASFNGSMSHPQLSGPVTFHPISAPNGVVLPPEYHAPLPAIHANGAMHSSPSIAVGIPPNDHTTTQQFAAYFPQ